MARKAGGSNWGRAYRTRPALLWRICAYNEGVARRDWRKVEGYDDILDSIALVQPTDSPEYIQIRVCESQPKDESEVFPPVDIWLPPEHFPKLDKLRKLIQKGLADLDHPATDPLADSLLPLIPITPGVGREKLLNLFSKFRVTSVTQTLVLPFPYEGPLDAAQPIAVGAFALKPFRSAPKVSAAFAAKSPLGLLTSALEERDGNWSIERTIESLPFCDVRSYENLLERLLVSLATEGAQYIEGGALLLGGLFFENYGAQYSQCLQERFLNEFRDAQSPHVALGGRFFPIQDVRGLDGCLFLDEWHEASFNSSRGVISAGVVKHGLRQKLNYEFSEFLTTFGLYGNLAAAISNSTAGDLVLRTFARILVMAREQAQEERAEVAFLLCCTALEYLVVGSQSEPIARTLGRRLGALRALCCDTPFHNAVRDIQQLYEVRSQFVHNARPIKSEELDRLLGPSASAYCAAAVASVYWREVEPENWIRRWHAALDYVAAALDAGETVDAKAITKAGIQLRDR